MKTLNKNTSIVQKNINNLFSPILKKEVKAIWNNDSSTLIFKTVIPQDEKLYSEINLKNTSKSCLSLLFTC